MNERSIFMEALDLDDPREQEAYVVRVCGDDHQLRDRVQALLRSHRLAGAFVPDRDPDAPAAATVDMPPTIERPGATIGPYRLMEQIGEGGFGLVFVAEQQHPVRRKVALKVIKPGMDTRDVIARFEAERQALALMDHPNIARVLDAGATASGRPYFVMELVKGVPITDYCDQAQLTPRERLELFHSICQAVQHAHQKGVIHRDLKPSNVLVTLHDGVPVVKVIDFGVAKAIGQHLTEKTIYTRFAQMIGTPLYMSPEQAEMSGLDIDTRSDIYSLGVLLYELLTGTTPFDAQRFGRATLDEIRRIIREEEPPRPSTRLTSLGATLTSVSAKRKTEPKKLSALIKGDLDWIVMKALEKDRSRRYETASAFAADVRRFLAEEPVEARPPSAGYRFRKLVRRNKAALTTVALVAGALVLGTAVATWQAVRATRDAVRATKAEARTLAALQETERARAEAVVARKKAEDFTDRLREATALIGRAWLHTQEGRWSSAHAAFARAEELQQDLFPLYVFRTWMYKRVGLWESAADDGLKVVTLTGGEFWDSGEWYQHALLCLHVGNEKGYREACRRMLERFGEGATRNATLDTVRACALSPNSVANPAELARRAEDLVSQAYAQWHLYVAGLAHYRAGHYEQAVSRLRQALTGAPDWSTEAFARAINHAALAMAHHRLAQAREARQALVVAEKAIDEWAGTMDKSPVGAVPARWFDWLELQLYYREAQRLIVGSVPTDDPRLRAAHERARAALYYGDAAALIDRGRAHAQRGEWDQAAAQFAQAADRLPADLFDRTNERNLTPICTEMVPYPEVYSRLIALRPYDVRLWVARARDFARKGEWAKAAADFGKAVELEPDVPWHWYRQALSHLGAGQFAEYRRTCAAMLERLGKSQAPVTLGRIVYTCVYLPDALPGSSALVDVAKRAVEQYQSVHLIGAALYRAGKFAEALTELDRAIEQGRLRCKPWEWLFAALAHEKLGHRAQARRYINQSKEWIEEADRREVEPGSELWFDPYQPLEIKQLYREAFALIADESKKAKLP